MKAKENMWKRKISLRTDDKTWKKKKIRLLIITSWYLLGY